jgi:membrane-associated protease RseP (regulator of RpoE activity)
MVRVTRGAAGLAGLLTACFWFSPSAEAQDGPVLIQPARIAQNDATADPPLPSGEFVLPPAPDEPGDLAPGRDSPQAERSVAPAPAAPAPRSLESDPVPPAPAGDDRGGRQPGTGPGPAVPRDPNAQNYLGVFTRTVPASLAAQFEETLGEGSGLLVTSVVSGSAAEQAGLRVNDILVSYDGELLFVPDDLKRLVVEDQPGATVELAVIRGARPQTVPVTLGQRSTAPQAAPAHAGLVPPDREPFPIGVHLPGHRSIIIDRFGLRSPWIAVDWGSPLAGRRFQAITPDGRQFEVEVRIDSDRRRWWRD